jgi:fucose permease
VRASLLVLAYFAFISLGLPDGLLGVGWPSIHVDFHVSTESVGFLLFAGTAGYLTSSVAAGFALARVGVGWLLAGSTAMASVALASYGLSPGLWLMVPAAVLSGFAGGAVDAGLNAYAANAFGARHMNWMHACFGLGVAIGPLIMTSVLGAGLSWRLGYGIVATGQLVLAAAFVVAARSWGNRTARGAGASVGGAVGDAGGAVGGDAGVPVGGAVGAPVAGDPHHAPVEAIVPARGRDTLALPAVWLGVLAFAMYVAIEVGAGLWAYLLLTQGRGLGAAVAGVCVSAYWASLFVGRVVQGVVAERLGATKVLVASLLGMAAGAVLVAIPAPGWLAAFGLALIGFSAAPVFPLLTLTTADRVGAAHADRAIGLQIAGSGLGGALIPAGIGLLIGRTSIEALGPSLVVLTLALLGIYGVVARFTAPLSQ